MSVNIRLIASQKGARSDITPPNTRRMKVRDAIKKLEKDGWYLVVMRGNHRQFKHPTKLGRVTVAGKPSDELAPGTLNSILKQAQLKEGK
jgi:predicted RNA binding protein YcfA (HicA-like mRNA interferase family)